MKKFIRFIFNLFWILIIGLVACISNAIIGILLCCTIIGIPFGLQYFKFCKLIIAPAGKIVITKYSRHPILNTFWLIFAGFFIWLTMSLFNILLYISIIGIPLALQFSKIKKFLFAPFGSEILYDGYYSKNKNLEYDIQLLNRHICANPNTLITIADENQTVTTYIHSKKNLIAEHIERKNIRIRKNKKLAKIFIVLIAVFFIVIPNIPINRLLLYSYILLALILTYFLFIILIPIFYEKKQDLKFIKKHFLFLIDYYPNNSPLAQKNCNTLKHIILAVGLKWDAYAFFKRIKKKSSD